MSLCVTDWMWLTVEVLRSCCRSHGTEYVNPVSVTLNALPSLGT